MTFSFVWVSFNKTFSIVGILLLDLAKLAYFTCQEQSANKHFEPRKVKGSRITLIHERMITTELNANERKTKRRKTLPNSLRLQDLPTEILAQITGRLKLMDYVNLVNLNREYIQTFGNMLLYGAMWRNNFSKFTKAYRVPESDDTLMGGGWRGLMGRIRTLETAIVNAKTMIQGRLAEKLSPAQIQKVALGATEHLVVRYACDRMYFIPLLVVTEYYRDKTFQLLESEGFADLVFQMCLSRRLLHLLNVSMALYFFQNAIPTQTENTERCLFELSRFDFGFHELCLQRHAILSRIQNQVDSVILSDWQNLRVDSKCEIDKFILKLGTVVLSHLPPITPEAANPRNILRTFERRSASSALHIHVIVGDILRRIFSGPVCIFGKLSVLKVEVTRHHLIVGQRKYQYDLTSQKWSARSADSEMPLSYEAAIDSCKLRRPVVAPENTIGQVPVSESIHLWNTTLKTVRKLLVSDDKSPAEYIIKDIRHDTFQIQWDMKRPSLDWEWWDFPSDSIGGAMSDVVGDIKNYSGGTIVYVPRKSVPKEKLERQASVKVSSSDLLAYMNLRSANYIGMTVLQALSTNFTFEQWAVRGNRYTPVYKMNLKKTE